MGLSPSLAVEKGHATTGVWSHEYPFDLSELTPELQWPQSVRVYDQMRRQDAQVRAVLRAITLPIRAADWHLDPNGARPEVVAHVAEDLTLPVLGQERPPSRPRAKGRFSWDDHLRLALLMLAYGHMPFEQVYRIDDAGKAHVARLGVRLPTTISKILTSPNGDLEGCEQFGTGAGNNFVPTVISVDRLVWYSNDREGAAWQGESILRPAYGDWLLKSRSMRVHAISLERNGMGVPIVEAPPNATDTMMAACNQLAQQYRAGEASGGALPSGARLRLVGVEGTLPDTLAFIRYCDEQTAKNVLAQFLELGSTSHGSRSLGESFIDFFQLALDAVAGQISDTFTQDVIEDLVDLNWGESEPAPRLVPGSTDNAIDLPALSLAELLKVGAITMDDDLEAFLRDRYKFPRRGTGPARPVPSNNPLVGASHGRERRTRPTKVTAGAPASDLPGARYAARLERHHGAALTVALAEGWDVQDLAKAWLDQNTVQAATAIGASADVFVYGHRPDDTAAADALVNLYLDSYPVGAKVAVGQLDNPTVPSWVPEVDWSHWKPGDTVSAGLVAVDQGANGLQQLLDDAGVTITGITDTTMDRIATALEEALASGASVADLADTLAGIVDDQARAELIAQTETARAMTVASLGTYADNGIGLKGFLTADDGDVDDLCQENEDGGPVALDDEFPNGDPPVHPGCRCAVIPVVEEDQ